MAQINFTQFSQFVGNHAAAYDGRTHTLQELQDIAERLGVLTFRFVAVSVHYQNNIPDPSIPALENEIVEQFTVYLGLTSYEKTLVIGFIAEILAILLKENLNDPAIGDNPKIDTEVLALNSAVADNPHIQPERLAEYMEIATAAARLYVKLTKQAIAHQFGTPPPYDPQMLGIERSKLQEQIDGLTEEEKLYVIAKAQFIWTFDMLWTGESDE